MKKALLLLFLATSVNLLLGQIWVNSLTTGRPIPGTYYLGDKLSATWNFQFEIGQTSWNSSQVGIGQNADGVTGWDWADANSYADGEGSNKRVQRNIGGTQFTATGTWFVVGRAKANEGDDYTYADEGGWTNETTLTASTTEKSCPYFTVSELSVPSSLSATAVSKSQIDLSWAKWEGRNVMIVRYKTSDGASNAPTNATAYSVNDALGTGTVVYNGEGTSFSDTGLSTETNYTYLFYSENWSFYSVNASTSATTTKDMDFYSVASGNWSSTSTWNNGVVPDDTKPVEIRNTVTLDANVQLTNLIIAADATLVASDETPRTITINGGGTLTNNGTFTHANGVVSFAGTATLSGTLGLNDVLIAGGVNFGEATTINGTLTVNAGGYADTHSPVYATGSTLKFSTGGQYNIDGSTVLWIAGASVGAGVPANVLVSTTTPLNIYAARDATGNLTIESGASVVQGNNTFVVQGNLSNAGTYSFVADGGQALTVKGDFINNGTASMSAVSGGDIKVEGDFSNNGTFTSNARAVFFQGANNQLIDGTQTNIDVVIIDKSAGSVDVVTKLISNELTVTSGTLNVQPDKQLTINNSLTNNATITLKSDASGTATILTPSALSGTTGTYNVQQYLTSTTDAGRSLWYIGTPVSGETAEALSVGTDPVTNRLAQYDETVPAWDAEITAAAFALEVGRGYALKLSDAASSTYTFTGTLNNGNINLTPTRTGTTAGKRGFNLVANPYPSYLNWNKAYNAGTNVRPTIWYRTSVTEGEAKVMDFLTYNAAAGVAVPASVTGYIPPMQAFWMRVDADGSNGTLSLTNDMREHRGETANMLKAPAANERPLIRLQVSNGNTQDELVMLAHQSATDGYDIYDSEKMSNNLAIKPEIYSLVDNQELVINTMNSFIHGMEIDLGFRPGTAGEYSIQVSQLENIEFEVLLQDKLTGNSRVLATDASYQFSADANVTVDRFSVLFRSPGTTTGLSSADSWASVYSIDNSRLVVRTDATTSSEVRVHSVSGQLMLSRQLQQAHTEINTSLLPGIYLVQVSNAGRMSTYKIVMK